MGSSGLYTASLRPPRTIGTDGEILSHAGLFVACASVRAQSPEEGDYCRSRHHSSGVLLRQLGHTTITVTVSSSFLESSPRHPLAKRRVSAPHDWHIRSGGEASAGRSSVCSGFIGGSPRSGLWAAWTSLDLLDWLAHVKGKNRAVRAL